MWYSLIIHIAGVRHLLGVNTEGLCLSRVQPYNGVVHHVLQVSEATPYIAQVVKAVVPGPRSP